MDSTLSALSVQWFKIGATIAPRKGILETWGHFLIVTVKGRVTL